ncbi:NUDIX hydrolase [Streptococcus sp. X16XC17]|uniref:NUDIX domain-containing protein n=1 Tax=unclassified Streptococcus TaxID=2608887 RepID=UPI00069E29D0|nr:MULTISPECIES: NUDIX hydrolase [unclassified Streptococcus]TCD46164.1 NUDIX hydrolase [Streptococcus sp. X16XC17]
MAVKTPKEMWDAYDKEGHQVRGVLLNRAAFPDGSGWYHMAINVWVCHEDNSWLFVRRAATKEHHPNVYEVGAGGSVLAGETGRQAAERELTEETGLVTKELEFLFGFSEPQHLTNFETYLATVSGSKDIRYQEGETDDHAWVTKEDLPAFLEKQLVFQNQKEQILDYIQKESE